MKPKILMYLRGFDTFTLAQKRGAVRADVIVSPGLQPSFVADLRANAPIGHPIRFLFEDQPQYVAPWDSIAQSGYWRAQEAYSIKRAMQRAAHENDWYLKDVHGQPLTDGRAIFLNWTVYCPIGTRGEAAGKRASQFYVLKLAQIACHPSAWGGPWSWDDLTTINGFDFEIMADCLGTYDPSHVLANACPRYAQGVRVAEGVAHACGGGGDNEKLSEMMRDENTLFFGELRSHFPRDFFFWINDNTEQTGPTWRKAIPRGVKFENWMRRGGVSFADRWQHCAFEGDPCLFRFDDYGQSYETGLRGSAASAVYVLRDLRISEDENLKRMRFGLGCALLPAKPAMFCYSDDEHFPRWNTLFDLELGRPAGGFWKTPFGEYGSVYYRPFEHVMVAVNPSDTDLAGVPFHDAVFYRRP